MNKERRSERMRLTPSEKDIIDNKRSMEAVAKENGLDPSKITQGWLKTKNWSLNFKESKKPADYKKIAKELAKDIKPHKFEKVSYKKGKDRLLILSLTDLHIGAYSTACETGEDYNMYIAKNRATVAVQNILSESVGFGIDRIVLLGGHDILHTDTPKRTTTAGTPQDTSGQWHEHFLTARDLLIDIIEICRQIAPVKYIHNPSNHDFQSGYMLAVVLEAHYKNLNKVTFDISMKHRKAFVYGKNMISTSHGDGAKVDDLPMLMATEYPQEWAKTKHRFCYIGHFHHLFSKDKHGITIESTRTIKSADAWHDRNGYKGVPKGLSAFIHDFHNGQVARLSHTF